MYITAFNVRIKQSKYDINKLYEQALNCHLFKSRMSDRGGAVHSTKDTKQSNQMVY